MTAPPGWHPDLEDARLIRYWDGARWTEHTAPTPEQAQPVGVRPRRRSLRVILGVLAGLIGSGALVAVGLPRAVGWIETEVLFGCPEEGYEALDQAAAQLPPELKPVSVTPYCDSGLLYTTIRHDPMTTEASEPMMKATGWVEIDVLRDGEAYCRPDNDSVRAVVMLEAAPEATVSLEYIDPDVVEKLC